MEDQSTTPSFVPLVTEFTPEQEIEFERMDRELDDYNMGLEHGKKLTPPKYDMRKFRLFRQWQLKRMNDKYKRDFPHRFPSS